LHLFLHQPLLMLHFRVVTVVPLIAQQMRMISFLKRHILILLIHPLKFCKPFLEYIWLLWFWFFRLWGLFCVWIMFTIFSIKTIWIWLIGEKSLFISDFFFLWLFADRPLGPKLCLFKNIYRNELRVDTLFIENKWI